MTGAGATAQLQLEETTSAFPLVACAEEKAALTGAWIAAVLSEPYPTIEAPGVLLVAAAVRVTTLELVYAEMVVASGEYVPPPAQDTRMDLPTSPGRNGVVVAQVRVWLPEVMDPSLTIFPSPMAPFASTGNCHGSNCRAARSPAVTTWVTVNPAECATGVVPSAPRITCGQDWETVPPGHTVTVKISPGRFWSAA